MLINDLSLTRFEQIYEKLSRQANESSEVLHRKAAEVEHLNLRLQIDELNEMERAQKHGVIKVSSSEKQ